MNITMISERGHVSALSACPLPAAAARITVSGPRTVAPVAPPMGASAGTGMPAGLVAGRRYGVVTPVRFDQTDQLVQKFDPNDPGTLTRRPPN